MINLWGFFGERISKKRFDGLAELSPKRICFGSTHRNALKRADNDKAVGYFNVPFEETVGEIFPWEIFKNRFGYSRTVKSESEFAEIAAWMEENGHIVFIRSLLDTCVAACEHQSDDGRSEIGELEYRAKWQNDGDAVDKLAGILCNVFERLYGEIGITAVCAVPSSTPGSESLPMKLAARLADRFGLKNITDQLSWRSKKDTIKDKEASAKWSLLEAVGLDVNGSLAKERILIIDDMYQSGATVHFVASLLLKAGADEVHCLAVSKSRGDKDNV